MAAEVDTEKKKAINYSFASCRTVENHIHEKLECYRRRLADAAHHDLLDTAVKLDRT